ncbi:unnamed protein product [Adineta ricciae]|uniref:Uncharacterized protein n=1 Tax=Adineta ricciae TaxID=249248 RepID=A0A815PJU1_ADIRI|nr:unnamed protein product [Adineta ricciae]
MNDENEDSTFIQFDVQQEQQQTNNQVKNKMLKSNSNRRGVMATEDQVTKHFYHNEFPNEYRSYKEPMKSILKKSQKKSEARSLSPCPSACSSSQKKENTTKRSDFADIQHIAELTAKQDPSSSSIYPRSLFSQTMNIFDPDNSYGMSPRNRSRPSRLQYYIKPYRGEPPLPTKPRSRSLPRHRITQTSTPLSLHSQTSVNQSVRPSQRQSIRKQHVSWSPARQRETPIPTKRKSIEPSSSSVVSIPICFHKSQSTQFPSPRPSLNEPCQHALISHKPTYEISYKREEEEKYFRKRYFYEPGKRHDETIEQYNRLLERMRVTDSELQSLSQSLTKNNNKISERRSVSNHDLFYPEVSETYQIEFFNG